MTRLVGPLHVAFVVPGAWLALFATAQLVSLTAWGRDGHPSNGVIVLLALLAGAVPAGIAAGTFALGQRRRVSRPTWITALLINACLTAFGLYHLAS